MPKRPCLDCGKLSDSTRCAEHTAQTERARHRRKDAQRPSPAARGYDAEWRKVREQVLERDHWVCRYCGGAARTVDHVVPMVNGGARLELANLVAACLRCNSRRGGATRRGAA